MSVYLPKLSTVCESNRMLQRFSKTWLLIFTVVFQISAVRVDCRSGLDPESGPHIAYITVRYSSSNETYLFECDQWLFKMNEIVHEDQLSHVFRTET